MPTARRVAALAAIMWCALVPDLVQARPVTYLCGEEGLEVNIDFTPRKAQLHLREHDHTLQRVKSAHDGHYVNRKEDLELVANKGDLRLREGKNELKCKLTIAP
jgi:hypothetical protein